MDFSSTDFWITLGTQVGIMLVIFLVNFFMLSTLVFKPTLKILSARDKKITGLQSETQQMQDRINRKVSEYEGLMEEARHIARMAREDILKEAEKQKQDIIKSARQDAENQLTSARQSIVKQVEDARRELKTNAQNLSQDMVNKILSGKAA